MTTRPTRFKQFLPALGLMICLAACESNPRTEGQAEGWQGTTVEEGSVLMVRTISGSVWNSEGRLIEETAIGTETRGENDLLGEVVGLDATADRIWILDRDYYTVRIYDRAGNHLMNIGRQGRGPGELSSPTDLGIDPVRECLLVRESTGWLPTLCPAQIPTRMNIYPNSGRGGNTSADSEALPAMLSSLNQRQVSGQIPGISSRPKRSLTARSSHCTSRASQESFR